MEFGENRNYKEKYWEIVNNLHIPGKPRRRILKHHTVNKIVIQCTKLNNKRVFSEKNIIDALSHLVKQQSAPNIELDVFDSNPLDFHYFIILFKETVKK